MHACLFSNCGSSSVSLLIEALFGKKEQIPTGVFRTVECDDFGRVTNTGR